VLSAVQPTGARDGSADRSDGAGQRAGSAERAFLPPLWNRSAQLRAVYIDLTPDRVLLERGFTAALFDDAMTDNSRKLARRRAGVSVVSSTFSIRCDRRSASDMLIARRSRFRTH